VNVTVTIRVSVVVLFCSPVAVIVRSHAPGASWYESEKRPSGPTDISLASGTSGSGDPGDVRGNPGATSAVTVTRSAFVVPWIGMAPFANSVPSLGLVTVSVGASGPCPAGT
jgi:hypothetical protein